MLMGKGVQRDPAQALVYLLIAGRSWGLPMAQFEAFQSTLTSEQIVGVEKAVAERRPASGS